MVTWRAAGDKSSCAGDTIANVCSFSLLPRLRSRLEFCRARPGLVDPAPVTVAPQRPRARAAPESRGRGVGSRRDADLVDRDRRGHRDARRVRLLPGVARQDLPRRARPLRQGRAGGRDHARRRARRAQRAGAGGRLGAHRRARGARPGDVERRALRAHRQGDGDAARARARRPGDPAARPGAARRDPRPRRPRRAAGVRPRPAAGDGRLRPHPDLLNEGFERIMQLYEAGVERHRHPVRVPRPRQAHVGLPARQPRHPRGAPVDGEVRVRALHRPPTSACATRRRWRSSRSRCRRPR